MKTTVKFIAAAFAIVAAASCTKEISSIEDNGREEATVETVQLSFPATLSAPGSSKTTLSGLEVHWTAGDAIYLYESGNTANSCKLEATSIEADYAIFSGEGIAADSYDAVYPHDAFKGGSFAENTLSVQIAVPDNFSTTPWGTSNIARASGAANGERLQFNNLLSHFKFTVESEGVASIEISAEELQHNEYTDLTSQAHNVGGTLVLKNGAVSGTSTDASITVTSVLGTFTPGSTYYVAFPPVKMKKLTFTLRDSSGNKLHTMQGPDEFSPEANIIYYIGSLSVPEVKTAQVGDYFYTDGTYSSNYDSSKTLAGIVFYVGDGMKADQTLMASEYSGCTHGLVLATTCANLYGNYLMKSSGLWDKNGYMSTIGYSDPDGDEVYARTENSYLLIGYNNTEVLKKISSTQYFIKAITNQFSGYTLPVVEGVTPWYLPSMGEFDAIKENYNAVKTALESQGYRLLSDLSKSDFTTASSTSKFFSSTAEAVAYQLPSGQISRQNVRSYQIEYRVLPIFAF